MKLNMGNVCLYNHHQFFGTNPWLLVSQNSYKSCLVTTHHHVNSDHQTANCCPSQQTTQCSPAVLSAQPLLASVTVYLSPFCTIFRHLSTTT